MKLGRQDGGESRAKVLRESENLDFEMLLCY